MKRSLEKDQLDVLFFVGGFQKTGGIESFLSDLLCELYNWPYSRVLAVWGGRVESLKSIQATGTEIRRTSLRHGCRFGIPDLYLMFSQFFTIRQARLIVFAKLPPQWMFRILHAALYWRRLRLPRFVYITPYRPSEMWPNGMPAVAQTMSKIIVQTDVFAADLRQMSYKGDICVVPLVPPVSRPTTELQQTDGSRDLSIQPLRLGFIGRLVAQKNVAYLISIATYLQQTPIEFHIFGGGPDEDRLRMLAQADNLPITFHGLLDRNEVANAIDSCDVFMIPSVSEGQCLAALEIISRGKPILATSVGALPEILAKGRFGYTIPLNNSREAAQVVETIASEIQRKQWNPEHIILQYDNVYNRNNIIEQYRNEFEKSLQ